MTELEHKIKVLVADDSALMRILIRDILQTDPGIAVIDIANNGEEAFHKTVSLRPDVVLLDMNMGDYDGLYAVKRIMNTEPTPIVILSAQGNQDMDPVLEALKAGAVDYLNKPVKNSTNLRIISEEIILRVRQAAQSRVRTARTGTKVQASHTFDSALPYDVVIIGASTGGPPAIEEVLMRLPENFALPVIVVQHMPPDFVPPFARRLNDHCALTVSMARKGDPVQAGHVLIAPGSRNMILRRTATGVEVDFTSKTFKEYNHPSINSVLESAAEVYGPRCIGVVLTGMGKDGTSGLKKVAEAGGYTIAQDEATSVVFGMPREAIESGCVKHVVPIHELGFFIVSCIS